MGWLVGWILNGESFRLYRKTRQSGASGQGVVNSEVFEQWDRVVNSDAALIVTPNASVPAYRRPCVLVNSIRSTRQGSPMWR